MSERRAMRRVKDMIGGNDSVWDDAHEGPCRERLDDWCYSGGGTVAASTCVACAVWFSGNMDLVQ